MKKDANCDDLSAYPEIMSKEQFRIACHISKQTALYLLQSGLVPSEYTGRRTRCYKIQKSHVLLYLQKRFKSPQKYEVPEGWHSAQEDPLQMRRRTDISTPSPAKLKAHYKTVLGKYPDVVDIKQVSAMTGYDRHLVLRWIHGAGLRAFLHGNRYLIPKLYLLEFLLSDAYNNIRYKSTQHKTALWTARTKKSSK